MLDRRELLIELARSNLLTPERQAIIRGHDLRTVYQLLIDIDAPASVLAAANLPTYSPKRLKRKLTTHQIQTHVDTHLAMLGIDTVPIQEVNPTWAEGRSIDHAWGTALLTNQTHAYHNLPYTHLPHRMVQIIQHSDDPVWTPLITLIESGVYPYGLPLGRKTFFIARAT